MSAIPWQRALIIGLGRSGLSAADLLLELGLQVHGYDRKPDIAGIPPGMVPFLGQPGPPDAAFAGVDLVVLSPGVPPDPVRQRCSELAPSAAIRGELGLGLELLQLGLESRLPPRPTVCITGTNGKSTVTALIGALLEAGGYDAFTGGNLGAPLTLAMHECLRGDRRWPDALVLECSSYQLETWATPPCEVAGIVNVSPDHLDRYPSIEAYASTKARIFAGLRPGGLALLSADDPWTSRLRSHAGPRPVLVDGEQPPRYDPQRHELVLGRDERLPRSLLQLPGRHNTRNALFAVVAARHLGVSLQQCRAGLGSFHGLPHRMVRVRELDGVPYYDDSKATNVAAVLAGLSEFPRPFVLIAGGQQKQEDLRPIGELLRRRGRGLVAIGESAPAFEAIARDVVPVVRATTMDDAVHKARGLARAGDAVVLAPACASFDQFRDYAARGDAFSRAVHELH